MIPNQFGVVVETDLMAQLAVIKKCRVLSFSSHHRTKRLRSLFNKKKKTFSDDFYSFSFEFVHTQTGVYQTTAL